MGVNNVSIIDDKKNDEDNNDKKDDEDNNDEDVIKLINISKYIDSIKSSVDNKQL